MKKDAHIVLAALFLTAGNLTIANAISLQDAVSQGLRDLPQEADQTIFASHSGETLPEVAVNGARTPVQVKAAGHVALAAQLKAREARESAALRISEVYLDMLKVHYQLSAAQKQVMLHEEALRKNQESAEQGAIEERLQLAHSQLRNTIAELERIRPEFLKQVGGEPGQMEIPPMVAMLQQPVIEADTSLNLRYLVAREEAAALELEVENAKQEWKPHLNVEAGTPGQAIPADGQTPQNVGSVIARAESRLAEALEARAKADQIASEALEIYSQISARLQQQGASSSEMLALANEIETAHQAGKRSVLELLEVRNAQFRAETAFAESHIEQRRQAIRFLAAIGQLGSHLDLKPASVPAKPAATVIASTIEPTSIQEEQQQPMQQLEPQHNGEIIAIVEPASAVEVASVGVQKEEDRLDSRTDREGVGRRFGAQIVAMVEPAVSSFPPGDLLPVSRDVTRRKREIEKREAPVEEEEEEADKDRNHRPFQKVMKLLKREKWRKGSR